MAEPTITSPVPISQFENTKLKESVERALEGLPFPGQGSFILEVENKGLGIMVVHRVNDNWVATLGARYTKDEGKQISARVVGRWGRSP